MGWAGRIACATTRQSSTGSCFRPRPSRISNGTPLFAGARSSGASRPAPPSHTRNLTFAAGTDNPDEGGRDDATFWYVKGGWLVDYFDIGNTAFVADYTETADISTDGDDGQSFGVFAVQNFEDFGTEIFGGFRLYDLDRSGLDTEEIRVGNVGARVKF